MTAGPLCVRTLRDGDIALIEIDNPPANALSGHVRAGLLAAVQAIARDASVRGAVLACAGRTFVAGADIKEFGKAVQGPGAIELFAAIEDAPKPIVAAIHGHALGGGLELALCCHGRVATPDASLGLTEVTLGLIPGCGGSQRLVRAIDPLRAARMVLTGERIPAAQAHRLGLLDEVAAGDLRASAVALARRIANGPWDDRRLGHKAFVPPAGTAWRSQVEQLARELKDTERAPDAVRACIDALSLADAMPVSEALKHERKLFLQLMQGRESRALRSHFLAERSATKSPYPQAQARAVERITVVGAGTMGRGIAISCASAGYRVDLVDPQAGALQSASEAIDGIHAGWVRRGRMTDVQARDARGRITPGQELAVAAQADLVIEAVFEELPLKQAVFRDLDAIARPGAVLASNTSTLDVNAIADATRRPQDVVGMHFFSPAHVMRLLEVIEGRRTAHDTLATAIEVGRRAGKLPVVVGVCEGFVANRMAMARGRQVEALMQEGALPSQIDRVSRAFGFAMGPCETSDLAGLDITWRIRKAKGRRAPVADALCEQGRFGQKTGKGYYRYESGQRTPHEDPQVLAVLEQVSRDLGIVRRAIDDAEVEDRLLLPLINEGARVLEEGIAARPGDIDVIFVYGYGWPARRGGPMFHADETGLREICERLHRYAHARRDATLEPAALLARLAQEGSTFYSLQAAGVPRQSTLEA